MLTTRLTLLCDYGLDDAIATVDLLRYAHCFSSIDVVAVGGNVSPALSLKNAKKLLANLNADPAKFRIVDTTALSQPHENLYEIHGADGMGELFPERDCPIPVLPFSEWMEEPDPGGWMLSLGPMTVTELLLKRRKPARFLFMAGCVSGVPNYKGYEFNQGINPAAFAACVKYPHEGILLDVACKELNVAGKKIKKKDLFSAAILRYREFCAKNGEVGCHIWDDIALLALLRPDWFTGEDKTDRDGNRVNSLYYNGPDYPMGVFTPFGEV